MALVNMTVYWIKSPYIPIYENILIMMTQKHVCLNSMLQSKSKDLFETMRLKDSSFLPLWNDFYIAVYLSAQTDRCLHVLAVHCGKRPERAYPLEDTQNIQGENDSVGVWPWQVSILSQPNSSFPFSQICGGVIIHESWIMTAAACVTEKQRLPVF